MVTKQEIVESMGRNAKKNGYYLCPDVQLFNDLIDGLATNTTRYGYGSCPCRIASGVKKYDADIICPCEYRDADVDEFGMCFCCMFVNEKIKKKSISAGTDPGTEATGDYGCCTRRCRNKTDYICKISYACQI
jgi:ferredoxin-thioredoxin reductase catalytic subunit